MCCLSSMSLDRNTPMYLFSVTREVEALCPLTLEDKEITAKHFIPTRSRERDTGYDVRCAEPEGLYLKPGCYFKMKLGFRMFAPPGWWLSLGPRSGTFINSHVHALYGVIDEAYENELCFVGQYLPDDCSLLSVTKKVYIPFGQRFAQVIPQPRWEMDQLYVSNEQIEKHFADRNDPRGTGGFGSSGKV